MDEDTPRSRQQSESQKSDKGSSEVAIEKVRGMHYYVITLKKPLSLPQNLKLKKKIKNRDFFIILGWRLGQTENRVM